MSERPILMSGSLVRATLEDRKTQTRRLVRGLNERWLADGISPYGVPGDRLWVRETFYYDGGRTPRTGGDRDLVDYRASHDCADWEAGCACSDENGRSSWQPSIHMPRWASRLSLEVTGVRVERLQDISEEDARAEGIERGQSSDPAYTWKGAPERREGCGFGKAVYCHRTARDAFRTLWDHINGDRATWESNPWVWVASFARVIP